MKFEIKSRFTSSILFSLETESLKLCVEAAVKSGACLGGADLRGAYLRGAYLRGAYLRGAYLGGADLGGADLRGAYLRGAYLRGAYLGVATPEEIARLDEVREIVLAKPTRLQMDKWHSENWRPDHTPEEEHACGSAHCIAGWLQALSPDPEIRKLDAQFAGLKLAPSAAHMFYTDDATALKWLTERDYAKVIEPVQP